jgi:hypothetical protein
MIGGGYTTQIKENGRNRVLGRFSTPEEAAFRYAEHIGAERAAAEADEARGEVLTAEEIKAAAAAEGLVLVPSASNESGFKYVAKFRNRYQIQIKADGKNLHLGCFTTPEGAALCYARHIGAKQAAAEADEARGEGLTAEEVKTAAAAEGLVLVPSASNESGFRNVSKNGNNRYKATVKANGKTLHLGNFTTPEGAALCYARHIGAKRAAAEADEAREKNIPQKVQPREETKVTISSNPDQKIFSRSGRPLKKFSK